MRYHLVPMAVLVCWNLILVLVSDPYCAHAGESKQTIAGLPEDRPKELFHLKTDRFTSFYAISPDGKLLAYGLNPSKGGPDLGDSDLILMDLETGREAHRTKVGRCSAGVFSPHSDFLALASSPPVVWDLKKWKPKVELKMPDGYRYATPLAFSPDCKILAGYPRWGNKKAAGGAHATPVVLWDLSTGEARLLHDDSAPLIGFTRQNKSNLEAFAIAAPKDLVDKTTVVPNRFVGPNITSMMFPDDAQPDRLFVEYHPPGFTTAWDTKTGKVVRTEWAGGGKLSKSQSSVAGRGAPAPGTCADLHRFRSTRDGRILMLPKFSRVPLVAVQNEDQTIALAATPTGRKFGFITAYPSRKFDELFCLFEYREGLNLSCRLSPDGRRLVALGTPSAGAEFERLPALRVWDISSLLAPAAEKMKQAASREEEGVWIELFKDHGEGGDEFAVTPSFMPGRPPNYLAMQALFSLFLHGDQGVVWLSKKLEPYNAKLALALIDDLGSTDFKARQRASRELSHMGPVIVPLLKETLDKRPALEVETRLKILLKNLPSAAAYELRQLRIIDLLEHINTPRARELLEAYAEGQFDSRFADEAREALNRLGRVSGHRLR